MGFSCISVVFSDTASDLNYSVYSSRNSEEAIRKLERELKMEHGPYNTPGWVNVALVLTEGAARFLDNADCLISKTIAIGEDSRPFSTEFKEDLELLLKRLNAREV